MRAVEDRLNNALDAALEMTFPASNPIAVYIAEAPGRAEQLSPEEPRAKHGRLKARIKRLKLEEQNLHERVAKRVSALESEGRWFRSDPLYQSLSSALASVRRDLRSAEGAAFAAPSAL